MKIKLLTNKSGATIEERDEIKKTSRHEIVMHINSLPKCLRYASIVFKDLFCSTEKGKSEDTPRASRHSCIQNNTVNFRRKVLLRFAVIKKNRITTAFQHIFYSSFGKWPFWHSSCDDDLVFMYYLSNIEFKYNIRFDITTSQLVDLFVGIS